MIMCSKCGNSFIVKDTNEHTCVRCGKITYFGNTKIKVSRFVRSVRHSYEPAQKREDELTIVRRQNRKDILRKNVIKDIKLGYHYKDIAEKHDIARSTVRLYATQEGLTKKPGERRRGKFNKYKKMEVVLDFHRSNQSKVQVAKRHKVSRMSLANWVDEYKEHLGKDWD